uniref:uncharacterized protein LOC122609262 n=1 Tax=Erigeron canadensis TaxID=72917 RepID=UPI001CB8BAA9|nr:uncharacterized protein LOC122609262 [Erigeron canadensis]
MHPPHVRTEQQGISYGPPSEQFYPIGQPQMQSYPSMQSSYTMHPPHVRTEQQGISYGPPSEQFYPIGQPQMQSYPSMQSSYTMHPPPVWTEQHWLSSGPLPQQYHLMGQPQMQSYPSMQSSYTMHPPPVWTEQHWLSSGPLPQQYHLMGQPQMQSYPSMQSSYTVGCRVDRLLRVLSDLATLTPEYSPYTVCTRVLPTRLSAALGTISDFCHLDHVPSFSGASYTAQKEASTISSGNKVSSSHVTVTPVTSVGDMLAEVKSERHWSPIPYVEVSAQDTEDLMQRKELETERSPLPRELLEAFLLTKKQLKARAKAEFTKMLKEYEEDIMNRYTASAWVYNFSKDMGWRDAKKKFEGDKRYQAVNEVDVRKGLYEDYMFDLQKKMIAKHAVDEKKFISTFNQASSASQDVAAEWQAHGCVDDDRIFYYNKITGKSNWAKPLELMTPLERDNADAYPLWEVITTSKGENYFYNKVTGESKWTLPDNVKLACEQAEKEASSLVAVTPVADVLAEVKLENSSLTGASKALVGVSEQDSEACLV